MVIYIMFLCSLCGKLFDDNNISRKVIFRQDLLNNPKEVEAEACVGCFNLSNYKYRLDSENKFLLPRDEKIKIYKISCSSFESKEKKKDDNEDKKVIDGMIKTLKQNTKKKI